jgi:His/Glu/Gln/Arg/opine family amino acid ABC transporter permease subunit
MEALGDYLPLLLRGTLVTAEISVLSYLLALALGIVGAVAAVSRGGRVAKVVVFLYTTLVRGIPDIVLILLVYSGGQQLFSAAGRVTGLGPIILSAFWAGVLAVGLIYGAYLVETFRGALLAVPPGQSEAARALGLPRHKTFFLVVLPQAMRSALPACKNYWQSLRHHVRWCQSSASTMSFTMPLMPAFQPGTRACFWVRHWSSFSA